MEYLKEIYLKNGKEAILRNGTASDGEEVLKVFIDTHDETDFLTSYPDENTITAEDEGKYLDKQTKSENGIEIIAYVEDRAVGLAGISSIGDKYKLKHRANFGISILKDYWGLGIGNALTEACIECAKKAGYEQLELEVVGDNHRAISLYKKMGFVEFGRNPKGFKSRICGYQELIYMSLELR